MVDISMPSLLRVLKLNCVNVECGPAVSWRLSCEEQLEQLGLYSEGEGRELPLPSTFLPHLRNLMSEQLEMLKRLEKLEQQKHMAQLEQLEQLEMHLEVRSLPGNMGTVLPQLRQLELLSWSPEELPESIWGLSSLTSLKLHAPQLVALPRGMSRLSRLCKLELIRCTALQHLPDFLTQLHRLTLRNTSIPSLPANFVQLIVEGLEDD
ncbi:unnamed protein product [Closterium sp. Naga37s-1]|nr:unnamed protein product [Closterium sp. Naga37s-1]